MDLPLHRLYRPVKSCSTWYGVADYPLAIWRPSPRPCWRIILQARPDVDPEWVKRNRPLLHTHFARRGEALQCLQAVLAVDPLDPISLLSEKDIIQVSDDELAVRCHGRTYRLVRHKDGGWWAYLDPSATRVRLASRWHIRSYFAHPVRH